MSSLCITLAIFAIGFVASGSATTTCSSFLSLQQLIKRDVTVGQDYVFPTAAKFTITLRTFASDDVTTWPSSPQMQDVLKHPLFPQAERLRYEALGRDLSTSANQIVYKSAVLALWRNMLKARNPSDTNYQLCVTEVDNVQNMKLLTTDPQHYKLRFQQGTQILPTFVYNTKTKSGQKLTSTNLTQSVGWSLDYYVLPADRSDPAKNPGHTVRSGVLYAKPCAVASTTGIPILKWTSRTSMSPLHYPVSGGTSYIPSGESDEYEAKAVKAGAAYSVVNQDSSVATCDCASMKTTYRTRSCACPSSSRI